jgi:hypothetical protein
MKSVQFNRDSNEPEDRAEKRRRLMLEAAAGQVLQRREDVERVRDNVLQERRDVGQHAIDKRQKREEEVSRHKSAEDAEGPGRRKETG